MLRGNSFWLVCWRYFSRRSWAGVAKKRCLLSGAQMYCEGPTEVGTSVIWKNGTFIFLSITECSCKSDVSNWHLIQPYKMFYARQETRTESMLLTLGLGWKIKYQSADCQFVKYYIIHLDMHSLRVKYVFPLRDLKYLWNFWNKETKGIY